MYAIEKYCKSKENHYGSIFNVNTVRSQIEKRKSLFHPFSLLAGVRDNSFLVEFKKVFF
jgi:hypothetical protein